MGEDYSIIQVQLGDSILRSTSAHCGHGQIWIPDGEAACCKQIRHVYWYDRRWQGKIVEFHLTLSSGSMLLD